MIHQVDNSRRQDRWKYVAGGGEISKPELDTPVSANQSASLLRTSLIVLLMVMFSAGCSLFKRDDHQDADILRRIDEQGDKLSTQMNQASENVRFEAGLLLGETENPAFTTDEFNDLVVELVENQRWRTLYTMVGRYPDLVTTLLIRADAGNIGIQNLRQIARFVDEQAAVSKSEAAKSWQTYIETATSSENTFAQKRIEFLRELEANRPTAALKLDLLDFASKKSDLMLAESHRLMGIAHLMLEDYQSSLRQFNLSKATVSKSSPYYATKVGLLLGEAHRHAGKKEQWKKTWQQTVETRIADCPLWIDPSFWQKSAFLRPVSQPWPRVVIESLRRKLAEKGLGRFPESSSADEAVVWAMIGIESLARHEAQNAILAFKKAEAIVSHRRLTAELQMQQALAMTDAGQNGPASAILLRLSSQSGMIGDRAKAILASMKLQNGSIAQGMNLLQSAIKSSGDWPEEERLKAHADFGLALLMRGRQQQGVQLLQQVHEQFASIQKYDHATQCLWNLAKYFENQENESTRQVYLDQIRSFERAL